MLYDLSYKRALELAEHLIATGQTTVYLRDNADDFPWAKVSDVVSGSSYRLNGPSSCYLIANDAGLTFKLNVEFEGRDANGRGVSLFERERLRDTMLRLPERARVKFARLLEDEVLPGLKARSDELRDAMSKQIDSEECVRGLIAFASPDTAREGAG